MKTYYAQITLYGQRLNYTIESENTFKVWQILMKKVLEITKTGVRVLSVVVKSD